MKNKLITCCLFFAFLFALWNRCEAQAGGGKPPLQVTPGITRALIDSIGQRLYQYYIFPDTALKMRAYLEQEFKKGAYKNIQDPVELGERLWKDLQKAHHDGHFRFRYAPDLARRLADTAGAAVRRKAEDSLALMAMRKNNFLFSKVEILPGNIGYAMFNGFTGFVKEATPTFTAAFRFLSNTNALIIDLRGNGGGSPNMVNQVESYFFPVRTHLNDIVDRIAGKKTDFWTNPEKAEGVMLRMPVYILTSKRTFSGAEDFAYGLQSVKRAVIVGDTTGGGAHPVGPFNVGLGFVADIPFARSLNPYTHTDWEGVGVIPDIPVASGNALEVAVKTILNEQR